MVKEKTHSKGSRAIIHKAAMKVKRQKVVKSIISTKISKGRHKIKYVKYYI